ncbi:tetratricopeptide (TPR) repeat protein [Chryseobacterium defluvii]|uniref:Tetratricopeptide (TPR) repeat protein n=1 Tax=Chryseobacterium defluvii TaxID=160396 RepID=A0A840K8E2_9FLAO|nr:hypothetical protein [Chryseobacterium defluvii]MBB4805549.1 tetratricopeptide (TPR) repeat protein [Chryseobacterium defluvii]
MRRNQLIVLFIFSFILIPDFFFSQAGYINHNRVQAYSLKEIDSLQNSITPFLRSQGKFREVVSLNKQLIQRSKNLKYSRGIISGYIHIANILFLTGKYDESLRFLKLAEKENDKKKDHYISSWLYIEFGNNFDVLGFSEKASQAFSKAIQYGKKIEDALSKKRMLSYAYNRKAVCKYIAGIPDSSLYYFKRSVDILPEEPTSTINVGDWYAKSNKTDSAEYYFGKAFEIIRDRPDFVYQKACLDWGYGTLYNNQKKYKQALEAFENSEAIFKQLKQPNDLVGLYELIAKVYDSLDMPEKSTEYFLKHTLLKDSLNNIKQPALDMSVIHFLEEQEQESRAVKYNLYYTIGGIIVVSIGIALLGIFYYRKNKRKEFLLTENTIAISQKDKEMEELKQKVNETFEEIIQLAKENSPEFWGRFQEVYPGFREKMLDINPGLKTTELILSAYIYLGFNTKDIADYTFKAVQTIKNNKYNLRKRLNVPPQDDIILWMRENSRQ